MYIFLILAVGTIIRIISFNQSLWLDEATTALVAKMPLSDIFTKFMPGDFHPPFYYLLMKYWTDLFGYSEISLRVPSLIFGILLVFTTYLIGREVFNRKVGLIAGGLTATSGLLIYYSQEARMYMMASFLVSLAVFSFVKTLKEGRVGEFLVFALSLGLIAATDYLSLLILPAFWIVGYLVNKKTTWWKKFIASHIILLLFGLGWAPTFIGQFSLGLSISRLSPAWWKILGQATYKNILLIPVKFLIGRISFDPFSLYMLIALISAAVFGFLVIKAFDKGLLIWLWLILPLVFGISISFKIPTLTYFRFIFCLPALYILVAHGIDNLKKRGNIFLVLTLLINLWAAGIYLFNPKFQREDWRGLAKVLGNDQIVVPGNSHKEALTYYGKSGQIVNIPTDNVVWLSRYVREVSDPTDIYPKTLKNMGYNRLTEYDFNGVIFWKYTK